MARISPLQIAPVLLFLALAGLFVFGMKRNDPSTLPSTRQGQDAPALSGNDAEFPDKSGFDDATLRQPGMKLVNFWASWCPPCRAEHPNLVALSAQGVPVYGINYKDEPDKARAFLDELGDPFAGLIADAQGRNGIEWGVVAMPESFVIDGTGRIVLHFRGPITQRVVEAEIAPLLAAGG